MRFEVTRCADAQDGEQKEESHSFELYVYPWLNGYSAVALAWLSLQAPRECVRYQKKEWAIQNEGFNNPQGYAVYRSYPAVDEAYFPVVILARDLTGKYHIYDDMEAEEEIGVVRILSE